MRREKKLGKKTSTIDKPGRKKKRRAGEKSVHVKSTRFMTYGQLFFPTAGEKTKRLASASGKNCDEKKKKKT